MALEANIPASVGWYVGEDKTLPFVIQDEAGNRIDISAFSLAYKLKPNPDDDEVLSKASGDGINITDGPVGEGEIDIEAIDTADLEGGEYSHAMVRSDEPVTVLFYGTVFLNKAAAP